jgi:RND family efflux transporter MFP subunit
METTKMGTRTNGAPVGQAESPTETTNRPGKASRRVLVWVALAGVLVALLLGGLLPRYLLSRKLSTAAKQQAADPPTVSVIRVEPAPPSITFELSGTMSALTEAPLLARTDGYLKKRFVDIGDRVKAGQLMGLIEAPDLDRQVQQARAVLEQSKAALKQTEAALEQATANANLAGVTAKRWATLQEHGAVSKQENDTYQTAYIANLANVGMSSANVAAARQNVASNQANLERYRDVQGFEHVRAPFSGVVTVRNVDVGALISSNSTLLFRIGQMDVLRTYIDVPQIHAPMVRVGQTATLSVVEYPNRIFTGKVTRTAQSLDPASRTMLTEVQVPKPDSALLPGMYTTVKLVLPHTVPSVSILGECLIVRGNGTQVASVTDQQTIHLQPVVVGHDYGSRLEILSGLQAGQYVVVNPNDNVQEGAKVKPLLLRPIQNAASPAGAVGSPAGAGGKANGHSQGNRESGAPSSH